MTSSRHAADSGRLKFMNTKKYALVIDRISCVQGRAEYLAKLRSKGAVNSGGKVSLPMKNLPVSRDKLITKETPRETS